MRYLTSAVVISIMTIMSAAAVEQARGVRPGTVVGAVARAQTQQAAPPVQQQAQVARVASPTTGNPMTETRRPDGTRVWIDMATGDVWVRDGGGNLIPFVVSPDEVEIPTLGVTVGEARRACLGIQADGFQAIFEENTHECLIPIVAHNWGGQMNVRGEDVVAWAPMGVHFRCNQRSFEQVSALRRSAQWVVPVMIVGGAGIGAGVAHLTNRDDNANLPQNILRIGSVYYNIENDGMGGDGATQETARGRTAFQQDHMQDAQIGELTRNLNACVRQNFVDLVRGNSSIDVNCVGAGCRKQGTVVVSTKRLCDAQTGASYRLNVSQTGFDDRGVCFYRINNAPPPQSGSFTFAADQERLALIREFIRVNGTDSGNELVDALRNFEFLNVEVNGITVRVTENAPGDITFNSIYTFQDGGRCAAVGGAFGHVGNNVRNMLAISAALAGTDDRVRRTMIALRNPIGSGGEVTGFFGHDTLTGAAAHVERGALIGAGVGTVVGFGYWLAEGRSVVCNVGGLQNVRLNQSWTIPTFREFIWSRNYVNPLIPR